MLKEVYLSELYKINSDENQKTLFDYKNDNNKNSLGTTIAVIQDPTGGIVDATDEFKRELGMPEDILNKFRETRENLNIKDDVQKHNKAVNICDLEQKYKNHLQTNNKAQESIKELASRVKNGETITLVCFEKEPKWCHRHILKEEIESYIKK